MATSPLPIVASRSGNETSPPKRIHLMQVNYRHAFGGSEKLAATLGSALDPQRFESTFVAMTKDGDIGEMLRAQGFKTKFFDRKDGFDPLTVARVTQYLRHVRPDVILTHHVGSLVYFGPPSWLLGIKLVHCEHDVHSFKRFPRELGWLRRLRSIPSCFVAIDPSIAEFLQDELDVPASKIEVIRNGIDLSRFHQPLTPLPPRPFTVGWVGRLIPPKRPDVLIDAMALLASIAPDIRCRIIGPGDNFEEVKALAARRGVLGNTVELVGPRPDIPDLLREIDCYVLCSDNEGLPIALIEAMATEIPCIVSAVGGIPAVVRDRENGYLLSQNTPDELARAILEVRDHPDEAQRISRQGAQLARTRYDLAPMLDRYSKVFTGVLDEQKAPTIKRWSSSIKRSSYQRLCDWHADAWARRRWPHRLAILNYHGVAPHNYDGVPSWLHLPEREFERQIRYLTENYRVISVSQAAEHFQLNKPFECPTACITFDDGYRNNATVAYPILKKHGVPATIYLATGFVGQAKVHWTARMERAVDGSDEKLLDLSDLGLGIYALGRQKRMSYVALVQTVYRLPLERQNEVLEAILERCQSTGCLDYSSFEMMSWEEAAVLFKSGLIEFGGHTVNHQILAPLDDEQLRAEIIGSIDDVIQHLGKSSPTFAYPNGTSVDFDERAITLLKDAGVRLALTTIEGLNSHRTGRFMLKRFPVAADMTFADFKLRVSGLIASSKEWFRIRNQ